MCSTIYVIARVICYYKYIYVTLNNVMPRMIRAPLHPLHIINTNDVCKMQGRIRNTNISVVVIFNNTNIRLYKL